MFISTVNNKDQLPALGKDRHTIICFTASRQQLSHSTDVGGTAYIQGAGDDSENWGSGLTPELFWRFREELLACPEEYLEALIWDVVGRSAVSTGLVPAGQGYIRPVSNIAIASLPIDEGILSTYDGAVLLGKSLPENLIRFAKEHTMTLCSTIDTSLQENLPFAILPLESHYPRAPHLLSFPAFPGKPGSRLLSRLLPYIVNFITHLSSTSINKDPPQLLFACDTGADFSVAAALVVLCLFYDDERRWVGKPAKDGGMVDKVLVKRRLLWIMEENERMMPSRASMTRVHGFLMGKPEEG